MLDENQIYQNKMKFMELATKLNIDLGLILVGSASMH